MKRLLVCLMILCLLPVEGWADFDYSMRDYDVSEDDLVASAKADYPDWDLIDSEQYWTGRWENELACWVEISLMRVTDCTLYQKTLSVIINPLKQGDPVKLEVTRDTEPYLYGDKALTVSKETNWISDSIYISMGQIKGTGSNYEVIETGHDYEFFEQQDLLLPQ